MTRNVDVDRRSGSEVIAYATGGMMELSPQSSQSVLASLFQELDRL